MGQGRRREWGKSGAGGGVGERQQVGQRVGEGRGSKWSRGWGRGWSRGGAGVGLGTRGVECYKLRILSNGSIQSYTEYQLWTKRY